MAHDAARTSAFVPQSRIRVVVRVRPKLAIEQKDSSDFLTIHRTRCVIATLDGLDSRPSGLCVLITTSVCVCVGVLDARRNALQLSASAAATEAKSFVFDQVFDPQTSQVLVRVHTQMTSNALKSGTHSHACACLLTCCCDVHRKREIYDQIGFANMLTGVLEGYHATIFAYGQVRHDARCPRLVNEGTTYL